MTSMTLSQSTQDAINLALQQGPGTNNQNYVAAYNAISADISSHGGFNSGTTNWFALAGTVNGQQFSPSAAGTFIYNYTITAARQEGTTLTMPQMQQASDKIAFTVFNDLVNNGFVFNDTPTPDQPDFSPSSIIKTDAGSGLQVLSDQNPGSNLDAAIWGGTLFARTTLQDSTYFSDYNINLTPGSADCAAIEAGVVGGVIGSASQFLSLVGAGNFKGAWDILSNGIAALTNLDISAIKACLPSQQGLLPAGASITIDENGDLIFIQNNSGGGSTSATLGDNNSYGQIVATAANGADTVFIAGQGGVANFSNATITLDSGTSLTINGSGNTINSNGNTVELGDNSGATLNGNDNTLTLQNNAAVNLAGTGNTVNADGASITLASGGAATIVGDGNSISLSTSDGGTLNLSGSGDTVLSGGANIDVPSGASTVNYNAQNQVTDLTNSLPDGTVVARQQFTYDTTGNLTSVIGQDGAGNQTWQMTLNANGSGDFSTANGTDVSFGPGQGSTVNPSDAPFTVTLPADNNGSVRTVSVDPTTGSVTVNLDGEALLSAPAGSQVSTGNSSVLVIYPDNGFSISRTVTIDANGNFTQTLTTESDSITLNVAPDKVTQDTNGNFIVVDGDGNRLIIGTDLSAKVVDAAGQVTASYTADDLKSVAESGAGIVQINLADVSGATGNLTTVWTINANGTVSGNDADFSNPSGSGGSVAQDAAAAAALEAAVNAWVGADPLVGTIDNSIISGLNVYNLGDLPFGASPYTSDPTGDVAGGAVIATGDTLVTDPVINEDGAFNSSPGDILSGYYRPGNQILTDQQDNLTDTLDQPAFDAAAAEAAANAALDAAYALEDVSDAAPDFVDTDPLVINLNGSGISLSNWISNSVYFDTNVVADPNHPGKLIADGLLHHTSWVNAGSGILVFEPGGMPAPITDITQTFSEFFQGNSFANGFAALASLAQPGATTFSRATALIDPVTGMSYFDEVMVWQDANQDGVSQPNELESLTALGITLRHDPWEAWQKTAHAKMS